MNVFAAFETVAIALGLGLLVGLQRERVHTPLAGVRTFALITLFGTICGMLAASLGPWIVAAGALAVAIATAVGNLMLPKEERRDPGITTEIAILLMYGIGSYLVFGHRSLAVALGGGVAVLLYAKPVLRGLVTRLGDTDMRVIMQFVLITLVILPVLPDRTYGPFQVLNPREIWWMVVIVVGMSLIGYAAFKTLGARAGVVVTGLTGGLISSTATTAGVARNATPGRGQSVAVLIIALASAMLHLRVIVEILVAAGRAAAAIALPMAVLLGVSIAVSAWLWWRNRKHRAEAPTHGNPTELKSALIFAVLYALVLLALAAAKQYFGPRGIYVAAGLSGLTDMDAVTLTTSRMAASGAVPAEVAWRSIALASISNLVFKGLIVAALGGLELGRRVAVPFAIEIAAAILLLVLWPR